MDKVKKVESVTAMGKGKRRLVEAAYEKELKKNAGAVPGPLEVVLVLDHLKPDFNVGKIFRSADVFGCREVFLIGIPFFDVSPARGSFRHVPARRADSFEPVWRELQERGYSVYALDPRRAQVLTRASLPPRSAFVLGNEGAGFSFDLEAYPGLGRIQIPQYGMAESLNVSVAASVALYEYVRQHAGGLALAPPKKDRRMNHPVK